jgi:hypothetical protein
VHFRLRGGWAPSKDGLPHRFGLDRRRRGSSTAPARQQDQPTSLVTSPNQSAKRLLSLRIACLSLSSG